MKELRIARKIIVLLTKDRLHYPGRMIADMFGIIARCGVLLILYWNVFRLNGGLINGSAYDVSAWSIFFYFAFSMFRLRDISRKIMLDIQSGNIEVLFSRPISYLFYRSWWQIGSGLFSFLVAAVFGTIALILLVGIPTTMTIGLFLPTLLLVFITASILSLIIYTIIGVLAFWMQDINPIFWIVDKAVMILGGSYLPIALFPPFMLKIALYSPFGASQFVTHTAYNTWQTDWYRLIGIQIFYIATLGMFLYFLFTMARKKVSVNGG